MGVYSNMQRTLKALTNQADKLSPKSELAFENADINGAKSRDIFTRGGQKFKVKSYWVERDEFGEPHERWVVIQEDGQPQRQSFEHFYKKGYKKGIAYSVTSIGYGGEYDIALYRDSTPKPDTEHIEHRTGGGICMYCYDGDFWK